LKGRVGHRSSPFAFALIFLLSLALLSCSDFLKSSSPKRDGKISGDVTAVVHVYRDSWGVPHIYADDISDLLYAQGFVHAQERLFQMDAELRIASGRLSEILGEKTLPIDILFRTLGLARMAEEIYAGMGGKSKAFIDRYTAGVNRYLETATVFPVEFRLLRYSPQNFKGSDVLLLALFKSFGLSQWLEKFAFHSVMIKAGTRHFEDVNPFERDLWHLDVTSPRTAWEKTPAFRGLAELLDLVSTVSLFPISGGSNSWVISGEKSSDGNPYLANDPHLPLSAPSVWFENHLVSPELNVYGYSFPGAPFVIIGFNEEVAWGFTNVMLDDVSFFIEKEAEKGETYRYMGREVPYGKRREEIQVRGDRAHVLEVRITVHGPVIADLIPGMDGAFAFRWTGQDATGNHIRSLYLLNRAANARDVKEALSHFELTAQNVLYATRGGDIGYQLAGKIPVRKKNHPPVPVPGYRGEFDWVGYHPYTDNPSDLNPSDGFIATANFPPVPPGSGVYISSVYEPPARGKRIIEVLSGKDSCTPEDLKNLQNDIFSLPARKTVPLILKFAEPEKGDDLAYGKALMILRDWDLKMSADSQGATIFSVFYEMLIDRVFLDELGEEGLKVFKQTLRVPVVSLDHLLFENPGSVWFDDVTTTERETREQIVADTFKETVAFLKKRLGENPLGWRWGELHRIIMRHPFGEKWYLKKFFNIGPEPVGGDGRTVFKTEFPHGLDFSALVGPSLRMVVSPSKTDDAAMVISTGQSGHFYEKHYRDQTKLWLEGRYRKVILNTGEVKEHFTHHLLIEPSG
jgi:penicillin amidase